MDNLLIHIYFLLSLFEKNVLCFSPVCIQWVMLQSLIKLFVSDKKKKERKHLYIYYVVTMKHALVLKGPKQETGTLNFRRE